MKIISADVGRQTGLSTFSNSLINVVRGARGKCVACELVRRLVGSAFHAFLLRYRWSLRSGQQQGSIGQLNWTPHGDRRRQRE